MNEFINGMTDAVVAVALPRYEELIRKEVLLRQIQRMVEEEPGEYYVNREPLKKILAVLE